MRCEFKDYPFENHLAMFDVNVNGPFKHIQCFLPHMIKNKSGQIVGISSVAGKISPAYRTSYGGSKHALIGIFDSLRT
jgi:short-subunit dehydrogenase